MSSRSNASRSQARAFVILSKEGYTRADQFRKAVQRLEKRRASVSASSEPKGASPARRSRVRTPTSNPEAESRFHLRLGHSGTSRDPARNLSAVEPADFDDLLPTHDFETEEAATKEDRLRARRMRRVLNSLGSTNRLNIADRRWLLAQSLPHVPDPPLDHTAAERLIEKLEAGIASGSPPATLASSMNMRVVRLEVHGSLMAAFEPYSDPDLRTFTILNRNWVFTPEEFDGFTAAQITSRLRTHLNRAGISTMPGPFICFLHGEFEPTQGVYVLHFHGLTTTAKAEALSWLKTMAGYGLMASGAAPVRREQVRDRARQFTYLLKAFWASKALRDIGGGVMKRDRKGRRIPEPYHSQYLLWLDRQRLADLTLMNDCWSPRNGGSEAMRALYLSVHRG